MKKITKYLNLNENYLIEKTLFKKFFYNNLKMKSNEKKYFQNDIEKIKLVYQLNSKNSKIPEYEDDTVEYNSILFVKVYLKEIKHIEIVENLIQKAIQHPVFLILEKDNLRRINLSFKRKNKADTTKMVIQESISTEFINLNNPNKIEMKFLEKLDLNKLTKLNLMNLYKNYSNLIKLLHKARLTGEFNDKKLTGNNSKNLTANLEEINKIDEMISKLSDKIKKTVNFNKKVEINMNLKNLLKKRKNLIQEMKRTR